ncbi:MAG: right-handed parallel beta-helix repeat-containing protein, partial [Bdellovibrionota bacterium]
MSALMMCPTASFADGYIYGALDTSSWTIDQWKSAAGAFQFNNVKCGSLLRTRIKNVRGGIGILTPVDDTHMKNLLYGNEIRNFSADALVANASDLTVENNKFLDGYADQADGDGNHDDIIQIFALGGRVFDNIVIHNNYIADTTNLSRPWQSGYQGISCFDGIVTNIKITNNVVLASAYHGISLYGARGALIANNTVINSKANGRTNWIGIFNLKDGTPPQNVVSKDNLASGFAGNAPATSYTSTNNYTVSKPLETFVVYDLPTATFDLTLKPTSPFFGKGAGAY